MTARELEIRLQAAQPPTLLHVLPPEVFAGTRIPSSLNACVYEMTFLDQVRALASDASAPIVVYGAGEGSLDAATADLPPGTLCAGRMQFEPRRARRTRRKWGQEATIDRRSGARPKSRQSKGGRNRDHGGTRTPLTAADAYIVECSPEPITDTSWRNMGTVADVKYVGNAATPGQKCW